MSDISKKSIHDNINKPQEAGKEVLKKESFPKSRKRDRFDTEGNLLITQGVTLKEKIYHEYKKTALFRRRKVYELINEAMEAYLPELKKGTTQKLKESGQRELDME